MKHLAAAALLLLFCSCESENPREAIGYHPFSTSVVEVTFVSDPPDTVWLSALTENNVTHAGQRSEEIMAAKSGVYYLSLITDRPSSAFLEFNDETFNLILLPSDTVYVSASVDEGGTDLNFSGRGSEINEYYKAKKATLGYTDLRFPINLAVTSTATYESVRTHTDSVIESELAYFNNYVAKKKLPLWFREYEEAEIRYLGLSVATSLPHNNELLNYFEDELPEGYYSFIKKEMVDNPKAVFSSHYMWFLDAYFITDLSVDQLRDIGSFSTINTIHEHTLKRSKSELTGEVRALYHKYSFSSIVRFFRDSTSIDSLARVYEVKDYEELLAGAGTRSKNNLAALRLMQGDTVPAFYVVNEEDSLVPSGTTPTKSSMSIFGLHGADPASGTSLHSTK
jgi:hypothetical protein